MLPDLLKRQNYFVGIYHKASHTTPDEYLWDVNFSTETYPIKDPESYYTTTKQGIQMALDVEQPFFLNINISDPHLPFYGIRSKSNELVNDPYVPSRLYNRNEIVVPGFLAEAGDAYWKARNDHFELRTKEEFYDYESDPDGIANLIDSTDPEIQAQIDRHRQLLLEWMIRTEDHALEAFRNLSDDAAIEAYWLSQEADPPFLTDLEKIERMFAGLDIDYNDQDSAFELTIDPRLTTVNWELLFSNDLNLWDPFQLADSAVTFNDITGATKLSVNPDASRMFLKLRGTTAND